jgi:hypothetical protein
MKENGHKVLAQAEHDKGSENVARIPGELLVLAPLPILHLSGSGLP